MEFSLEDAWAYAFAAGRRGSYGSATVGKSAVTGRFGRLLHHGCKSSLDLTYTRPTEATKVRNYAFDAFGPYSIAGAALAAGIGQADDRPPDWKQGVVGYSERFGSDFGIAAIGTTTRYALAEAFRED